MRVCVWGRGGVRDEDVRDEGVCGERGVRDEDVRDEGVR